MDISGPQPVGCSGFRILSHVHPWLFPQVFRISIQIQPISAQKTGVPPGEPGEPNPPEVSKRRFILNRALASSRLMA